MGDRGTILVVSDDARTADELGAVLDGEEYELLRAGGSAAQAAAALAGSPDLIVVDTRLAAADPFDLADELHHAARARDLPVVFLVPEADVERRARSLEAGDELLSAPLDAHEARSRIERQVTISKARAALRQSEARFRSVMESAIDAIVSADGGGVIRAWNTAAAALFGHTEDEAVGRPLELIIPERFRARHRTALHRVSSGGPTRVIGTTVELAALRKDGTEIPVELSLTTWFLDADRYYTGIIRDISERVRADEALSRSEEALRRSEEDFRRREAEFQSRNAALEASLHRLGTMQDQLVLQEKMASLGRLSAGMAHEMNNPASAAQRGASQAIEVFARLQEAQIELGRLGLYGTRLAKLRELDALAASCANDPFELGALERSDREADVEEWLETHGVRSGGDLAAAIVGLGIVRDDLDDLGDVFGDDGLPVVVEWLGLKAAIYALLSEIVVGTSRIVELVRALKTYTYMDQAPMQDVDVRAGLENTLVILHGKLRQGVTVRREFDDDLPTIHAYASELNQVWTNLIDNAVDAMGGEGTVVLRARRVGDEVEVQVEDDGPGVPPDIRSKLFDLFFTTKAPGEGTGLGLAISRTIIVKKHHGTFELDSRPGCTRFTVRLPISRPPGEEDDAGG